MTRLVWLALTSLLAAGGAQAQTWSRFINSSPVQTTTLAPQGLAADGHGGVFVQTLDATETSGTSFSHIYALDGATGDNAYPWSLIGRPGWTDTSFVAKGFNAHAGHRAAWFEVGLPNQLQDMIWSFEPSQALGTELRLDRLDGGRVLAAATDGTGGLLVVRDRSNGWNRPVLRRYARSGSQWSLQWEQMLGSCYPGTIAITQEDVDVDLDADPNASAVHLVGYCNGGIAGISTHYAQSFDLNGVLRHEQRFRPAPQGISAAFVARHRLGDGAWAYEYKLSGGGPRLVQVGDARFGLYPLNWNADSGALHVDAVSDGVLIGARVEAASPYYDLTLAQRAGGDRFEVQHLIRYAWQPEFEAASTRWSADASGNRVVAYRASFAGQPDVVVVQSYGGEKSVIWSRTIDNVGAAESLQLRYEPASDEILLATDRRDENGLDGVLVERFGLGSTTAYCPPHLICLDPIVDPRPRRQ